jgi:U3 small nucleolar RNA-associated protein 5
LITHGGYIASQPDLIRKLGELNKVIEERARGLQSLLLLKGKLDMLESQMELRRSVQQRRQVDDDSDDEEGVIYVEGQDESEEESGLMPQKMALNGDLEDISDAESDDMPTTNGGIADSDDEEDESSEEDLIDDEAEESDNETWDEDEVDHEDMDSEDGDEESDEGAAPPRKVLKSSSTFGKRR